MHELEVPQDGIEEYQGYKRVCYATRDDGTYQIAKSTGWHVELYFTRQAHHQIADTLASVRTEIKAGNLSPLAYFMHLRQMTPSLLAQEAGIARWRVQRHLRPRAWSRLRQRDIVRYAQALQVETATLACPEFITSGAP